MDAYQSDTCAVIVRPKHMDWEAYEILCNEEYEENESHEVVTNCLSNSDFLDVVQEDSLPETPSLFDELMRCSELDDALRKKRMHGR